jgi:hypothetical protein
MSKQRVCVFHMKSLNLDSKSKEKQTGLTPDIKKSIPSRRIPQLSISFNRLQESEDGTEKGHDTSSGSSDTHSAVGGNAGGGAWCRRDYTRGGSADT